MFVSICKKPRAAQPTSNLHDVARHKVSGLDPLHSFPVLPVHFPHLRLILLECLNGILSIAFLVRRKRNSVGFRDELIKSHKLRHACTLLCWSKRYESISL